MIMDNKWKGVIIEESLDDKSILDRVKIVKSKKSTLEKEAEKGTMTFHYIELNLEKKDGFVKKALGSIKDGWYLHICKDGVMVVIYRNKVFEFSSDEQDKLNQARDYGISISILKEQMPFEVLVKNPYG